MADDIFQGILILFYPVLFVWAPFQKWKKNNECASSASSFAQCYALGLAVDFCHETTKNSEGFSMKINTYIIAGKSKTKTKHITSKVGQVTRPKGTKNVKVEYFHYYVVCISVMKQCVLAEVKVQCKATRYLLTRWLCHSANSWSSVHQMQARSKCSSTVSLLQQALLQILFCEEPEVWDSQKNKSLWRGQRYAKKVCKANKKMSKPKKWVQLERFRISAKTASFNVRQNRYTEVIYYNIINHKK